MDKEILVELLADFFNKRSEGIHFDDEETIEKDARRNAFKTLNYLRACGWLDFEDEKNYRQNVVLTEYAIPFIKTIDDVIKNEEVEYQGLISQIYAMLENNELYVKPYHLILKNVVSNTEQLVSGLKKLSVSIKKHIDAQTKNSSLTEVLDLFHTYNDEIISKSLYRLKTSENVAKFRQAINRNLDTFISDKRIFTDTVNGYMEVEQEESFDTACDRVNELISDVKSDFYNLDTIIKDIDRKHLQYMRNAHARARFELASGANQEGKIAGILKFFTEIDLEENTDEYAAALKNVFALYTQKFLSDQSLRSIGKVKTYTTIEKITRLEDLETEKEKKKKEFIERQKNRIDKSKIEKFVLQMLKGKTLCKASQIRVTNRKDFVNIIYILLYGKRSKIYSVKLLGKKVTTEHAVFRDFEIVKK